METVRAKTIEDCIRDLVPAEMRNNYECEKKILEILEMIESEKVAVEEWWKSWAETIETNNKRLKTILDCMADAIILKEEKLWKP